MPDPEKAPCPECKGDVPITDPTTGVIYPCPDCGVDLELTNLKPMTLTLAPQEAEDWGE